jgi:hypothetical protein
VPTSTRVATSDTAVPGTPTPVPTATTTPHSSAVLSGERTATGSADVLPRTGHQQQSDRVVAVLAVALLLGVLGVAILTVRSNNRPPPAV